MKKTSDETSTSLMSMPSISLTMIAGIMSNKRFQAIIKDLFIRCRKLNISLDFITQPYFSVLKNVSLNSTHYWIMEINIKRELQNIDYKDIDYKDFMKFAENMQESRIFLFLTIDTTLPASHPVRFRKNLFDSFENVSN